jgi:hypothetical protein
MSFDMNPLTAAAIFIPLSFGVVFASDSFRTPTEPVALNVEVMKELNINPEQYFLYLQYDSCVRGISQTAHSNNISSGIKNTCNPILKK